MKRARRDFQFRDSTTDIASEIARRRSNEPHTPSTRSTATGRVTAIGRAIGIVIVIETIGDAPVGAVVAAAIVIGAVVGTETEIGIVRGSADDPETGTVIGTLIDQAPATSTVTANGKGHGTAAVIGIETGIGIGIEAGIVGAGATVVRNRVATTGTATATETEIPEETAEAAAAIPDGAAAHARKPGTRRSLKTRLQLPPRPTRASRPRPQHTLSGQLKNRRGRAR